jgi:hypothetical protein
LYCDRWITDYDFVRIIACEHDLASYDTIAFDVVLLNKALKVDSRFKGAEDADGCEAGTVFRKDYSPSVFGSSKRRKVFCYYIVKTRPPSKPSPDKKWSDDIKSMSANLRKKCAIAEEAKNDLAKILLEAAKNDLANDLTKKAKKLQKDIASTTPAKSNTTVIVSVEYPLSESKAISTHFITAAIHPPIEMVVPHTSPYSKSQAIRKPRMSVGVLEARSSSKRKLWKTGTMVVDKGSDRKIRKIARDLEDTLQIDAGCDVATAGAIIATLLRRQSMSQVTTHLTDQLSRVGTEAHIAIGKTFLVWI